MRKLYYIVALILLMVMPLWAGPRITAQSSAIATIGGAGNIIYSLSIEDDDTYTLPTLTNSGFGTIVVGNAQEDAEFVITSAGTVTLIYNSASITKNADTDDYFCIGTSAANPLILKNRLGATKAVLLNFWYH